MDSFDSMLRERLARLMAATPGDPGPPPQLSPSVGAQGSVGPRWGLAQPRDVVARPRRIGSLLGGLAAVVLLVAIGGVALYLTYPQVPAGEVPVGAAAEEGPPTVWDSGFVRLRADSLRIEADGKVFTAEGITPDSVTSDSGKRYGTLEVIWHEHEVEMRMHIYFAADDRQWWATEVRVYDGREPGGWIGWGGSMYSNSPDDQRPRPSSDYVSRLRAFGVPADAEVVAGAAGDGYFHWVMYRGSRGRLVTIGCDRRTSGVPGEPSELEDWEWKQAPAEACGPPPVDLGLFRSRLGEAWSGDLDLVDGVGYANGEGRVSGDLHIHGLRVSAFQ